MGTLGSPLPHLLQNQSQSQSDVLAEGAVPSGLAAVAVAPVGIGQMMMWSLSPMETGGLAPGVEDLTPAAQTPTSLASTGSVV